MKYTLNQLQIFLTITQTMSITKAALDLHLTQPAVSIQLKNFQDQFDIPLTELIGRRLFITDFGKEVAAAAENILNEVYAINYKTMAYKGQLSGRLKISVVSTGKYIMPFFLSDFMKIHDGIDLELDVTNKMRVIESLQRNEIDFALVSVLPDHLAIENEELLTNKLYLVGNPSANDQIKTNDKNILEKLPLIFREEGSGTRSVMEQYFRNHGLIVRRKMELTSNEAVKQAVIAGLGYSIMPLIGIQNELNSAQLKIIPVKGFPISSTWNLIWLKQKKFSPVAASFLNYVKENKKQIIEQKFSWYDQY